MLSVFSVYWAQLQLHAQVRLNQIANCENADGISTILSIVCPYMKQGCIQIFFMQKIVEKQQEERETSDVWDFIILSFIRIMFKLISVGYVEANSWSWRASSKHMDG